MAKPREKRRIRLGAALAVVVAIAFLAWLLLKDDGGDKSSRTNQPAIVSVDTLNGLESSVGHPVYWIGPRVDTLYELTKTDKGRIYVRYLPPGERAGTKRGFLSIGTYPYKSAYATVNRLGSRPGTIKGKLDGGGLVVQDLKHPSSVYVVYPGLDLEIEVYDPNKNRARQLAFSNQVRPVQ